MQKQIHWQVVKFSALSSLDLYQILQLRSEVFVVEQNCVYQDIDGIDVEHNTLHVFGRVDARIVAYGRVYVEESQVHLGRVVCALSARSTGCGTVLLQNLLAAAQVLGTSVFIAAQVYLRKWYEKFGFKAIGNEYLEDGIPHIDMTMTLDPSPAT